MSLLNYSLTAFVTYLGLIAGMILAFSTEEELKPGRKYFAILQHVCYFIIFGLLFYYFGVNKLTGELTTTAILFVILSYLCYHFGVKAKGKKMPLIKYYIIYAALAIIFYLSSKIIGIHIIISSVIFVYGLPTGTILTDPRKKAKSFWLMLSYLIYPAIAVILKLILL